MNDISEFVVLSRVVQLLETASKKACYGDASGVEDCIQAVDVLIGGYKLHNLKTVISVFAQLNNGCESERGASVVYVVKSNLNGLVKIGTTTNFKKRRSNIENSSGSDIEVLAMFYGSLDLEKQLHRQFADKRKRGEWFQISDDDLNAICSCAREFGADKVPDAEMQPPLFKLATAQ